MTKRNQKFNRAVKGQESGSAASYTVAVFAASSRMKDPAHRDDALYVGTGIGKNGYRLVYGAGSLGLAGIVSGAALAAGGEIKGYALDCFAESDQYPQKQYEQVAPNIAVRKQHMIADADAYIALAGGLGTVDEIFEAATDQYLGAYTDPPVKVKPLIIVNRNGLYDALPDLFGAMIREGSARPALRDLFTFVTDGREAMAMLEKMKNGPARTAKPIGNVDTIISGPGRKMN